MPLVVDGVAKMLYLLDTNILVRYARKDDVSKRIEADFGLITSPVKPFFCYVSEGEIRSLAQQWNWGAAKTKELDFLLDQFLRVPIEQDGVLEAYVEMDVQSRKQGIVMGKNDLWIAACASVAGAVLLTTDKDFLHLDPQFLTCRWFDPAL